MAHLLGIAALGSAVLMATPHVVQGQRTPRELGLDIFGISWHYSSRTYPDGTTDVPYNERNWGAGVHVLLQERGRQAWTLKAGGFRDSKDNVSLYAGPVWQYRVARGLALGGGILLFKSETYAVPVIPLPLATYRAGPIGLNATWIPPGAPEESGAFAFFGTVVLWRRR